MAYHSNGGYSGDERESRSGDDRPDSDLSDKPIYLLEHLATFTVNKDTGIVYPADGMRRLLQLEKTTGIWSQKMQLCLDNQWVLIMDYETGNIIERFPASLIQEPTAFTSNNPMEMYNNILVFIVAGDSGSRSEMHIFQSQSISAVHLVEDLKQLRNGKNIIQNREKTIPPPPMKTSISSVTSSTGTIVNHQNRESYGNIIRSGGNNRIDHHIDNYNNHDNDSEIGGINQINNSIQSGNNIGIINDETSSISSDKYERDVTVLNHCFDDIEKFIARLQHAAAATRELERRRRNRKSKKKDPGEGLLTLRTRPPHEKEFIDIFAKFKLSFNLLAKLKQHIHDPNAPELVHFLFTPLALIVEASSDTYYESHLPSHVLNPLLTREAINLLINCVTSKETELWRSLGDPWIIPRDQWKGHIGSYHPVFFDGWSPDYPVVDELENATTPTNTKRNIIDNHHHHNFITGGNRNIIGGSSSGGGVGSGTGSGGGNGTTGNIDIIDRGGRTTPIPSSSGAGDYDYDGPTSHHHHHNPQQQHHHHHTTSVNESGDRIIASGERTGFRDFSTRSDISIDSIERNGLSNINTLTSNGGGNGANNSSAAIQSLVGGIQSMGGLNTNQNINSRNANSGGGGSGPIDEQDIELWLDKLQSRGAKIVQVTYPRTANNDKELTVIRGEYLEILDDNRKWWKARNSRGQTAHVPHTIVTPYNYPENSDVFNNPLYTQQQQQQQQQQLQQQQLQQQQQQNYNKIRQNESEVGIGGPQQNSAEWIRNKHIDDRYSSVGSSRNIINDKFNNYNKNKLEQNQHEKEQQQINSKNVPPPPPPPPFQSALSNSLLSLNRTLPKTISINDHSNTSTLKSNNNGDGIINNHNSQNNDTINSSNSSNNSTIGAGDDMQEELKRVLTLFREKRRNLDIIKTPEIYIQQTSKPNEIDKWLKGKGFSQNVIKKLHGLNGNELFALKRDNLEKLCGLDEGKRLASQITIQRNVSGYKTARTSELQAILARAREKSEQ